MIYVCADDYGLTKNATRHIDECIDKGKLNKVSFLLNVDDANYLREDIRENLSLHINLVEGKPVSDKREIDLLVTEHGYLKHGFFGLLMLSLFKRRKAKEQIKKEMASQIKIWREIVGKDTPIMLDSHQHTIMIPLLFKVLTEIVLEEGIKIKYLRVPKEPISPYIKEPSLYLTYNPVNVIKQWVLNIMAIINQKQYKKLGLNNEAYFMGVLFSGNMDKRVLKILPHYEKLAKKHGKNIELLFHPGYIDKDEVPFCDMKKGFLKFYHSKGRKTEFDTLMSLDLI